MGQPAKAGFTTLKLPLSVTLRGDGPQPIIPSPKIAGYSCSRSFVRPVLTDTWLLRFRNGASSYGPTWSSTAERYQVARIDEWLVSMLPSESMSSYPPVTCHEYSAATAADRATLPAHRTMARQTALATAHAVGCFVPFTFRYLI